MKNHKELNKQIKRFVRLAKKAYPDLKYSVHIPGYEDQDANIDIFCPPKYEHRIEGALRGKTVDLLVKKDIFIVPLIFPLSYYKNRAS